MCLYDSAQASDLVGLYLFSEIVFPSITGGLYGDDVLFPIRDHTKTELNMLMRSIKTFMKNFFNLEIEFNTN